MAKSLLLNVLVDVLGNYVEGLSRENLKVAVWSGTIDLSNLKLKGTALDNLNLPIKVERGYLKKLHLKIPWASLESKPVVVELDGVYLQAGPLDMANLGPEEAQHMIAASNNKKLDEAERSIMNIVQKKEDLQDTAKKATYVQQLTAKIIDNLEVSITNLHVRYEDTTSIPGSIFSCGFTIESLSLTTTDETWSSRFVSRDLSKRKETAIHKLGTMENFGVYWNTASTPLVQMSYKEWEAHMLARIFRAIDGENSPKSPQTPTKQAVALSGDVEQMSYLLAPPNSFSMKVAHREVCTESQPKLDVLMDSTTIPFQIRSDQYQQVKLVSQEFRDMDRRRLLITHRPSVRPTAAPREWWLYAYRLVTGKNLDNGRTRMQLLHECVAAKKIYVPHCRDRLVRREIIDPLLTDSDADQSFASSHSSNDHEMQRIRETLPLATLVAFHQTAAREAVVEILRLRADPQLMKQYVDKYAPPSKRSQQEKSSFWGSSTTKKAPTAGAGTAPQSPAASKPASGGFFGFFSSSKPKETPKSPPPQAAAAAAQLQRISDQAQQSELVHMSGEELEEDEKLMQSLETTLSKYSEEAAASAEDQFTLRVKVVTSAVLSVLLLRQPVVFVDMSMRSRVEVKKTATSLLFEVDKLSVDDSISIKPVHTHLLSMLDAKLEELSVDSSLEDSIHVPRVELPSSLGTPIALTKPKFAFAFETANGQSTLRIKSSPVKIVLNEPCIRGLMTCFTSPVAASASGSPLLLSSMNAISSRIALPEESGLVVDMEVYAPTVIIPEEYDADNGCVQLDTGKLLVHGNLTPKETSWDVVIRAVNIGMPGKGMVQATSPTGAVQKLSATQDQYLVKPFDVKISVKTAAEQGADVLVGIEIAPAIEGQLDALKLVRLKYITDVLLRSMQPLPPDRVRECAGGASTPGAKAAPPVERHIYDSDVPIVPKSASIALHSGAEIDYKRVTLSLIIKLRRLAVVLAIATDHTAELSLSDLDLTIVRRAGDMNVLVSAQSLSLTDSMRPLENRAILWTVGDTAGSQKACGEVSASQTAGPLPLLKVAYRSLTTPLSPLYNGNQTELSIICSTLRCGIDDVSTMRYVPFTASIMEQYAKYYGTVSSTAEDATAQAHLSISAAERRKQQAASQVPAFGGTQVIFSVAQIGLDILCESDAAPGQVVYESAFSTSVNDIFVRYFSTSAVNEVDAHIAAIDIKDARQSSAAFVYNTLFTRNVASDVLRDASPVSSPDQPQGHSDKILSVRYVKQIDALLSTVEVFLQDITSYVSVDIIMAFVDLILSNLNAVNAILLAINGEQDITEIVMRRLQSLQLAEASGSPDALVSKDSIRRESLANLDELRENLNVTVTVVNPRLLLLENPENRATKAIVSDCTIYFHYSQEKLTAKKAKRFEVTDTFHCALQKAQVFVLANVSENTNPHKIIAPTGVDVHAKRQSENGVMLTNSLNVGSEPIVCRVSLNDIVLSNKILDRAKLTKQRAQRTDAASSEGNVTGGTKDARPVQSLTLLSVQLNFATISVVLLNDYRDLHTPMFRVILDHFSYNSSGAIGRMDGEGSMLANADFYNASVAMWEPVLEPWIPSIKLRRDGNGTELSMLSRGVLQVNVSGAMCNGIYTCMTLLTKIGQEGSVGERKRVLPLVVRNFLGTPLELFDGRTGQSIVMLMDDAPVPIPPKDSGDGKSRKQGVSYKAEVFPDMFELRLLDRHVGERAPITQIPMRAARTRLFHFLPFSTGAMAKKNLQSEPITEEVYENQRYYPMKFAWGEPWTQMSDPGKWTDSRGQDTRDPSAIKLPAGWDWVESKWMIDVGKVGVETDNDGWYYNSAFGSFTASRKNRRAQQPLDVVRRRRWIRTRALKRTAVEESTSEDLRPIPVFWDVLVKSDEAREIVISSGMEFVNNSPCPVEVQMLDVHGNQVETLPPMSAEQSGVLRLPFSAVSCSHFRIRPLNMDFGWSDKISCKLKTEETVPQLYSINKAVCAKPNFGSYHLVVHVQQKDKRVTMTCAGCAEFYNHLPCQLSVLFSSRDAGVDSAELDAGGSFRVTRASVEPQTEVSLAIGDYATVRPVRVAALNSTRELVVWLKNRANVISGDTEPDLVSITLQSSVSPEGVLVVSAFSQYLLIDQSDTGVQVRSDTSELPTPATTNAGAPSDIVIRRTYQHEKKYTRKPIIAQIQAMEDISLQACWAQGNGGVTMFQSGGDNKIALGVNCGTGLLRDVSLDALTIEKSPVEIIDPTTHVAYNLAVTLTPLPGPLCGTRLLRVMPAYTIVNCLDEAIELLHPTDRSQDTRNGFTVEPKAAQTWHRPVAQPGTALRLRSASTAASVGCIDINEIGASLLLMPRHDADSKEHSSFVAVHVEVKFSESNEASYITVVIWRAEIRSLPGGKFDNSTAMLSVKNETDFLISVHQEGAESALQTVSPAVARKCELLLQPGEWQAYGWIDGSLSSALHVAVSNNAGNRLSCVINTLLVNTPQVIGNAIELVIRTIGNGKVLFITKLDKKGGHAGRPSSTEVTSPSKSGASTADRSNDLVLKLRFQSVGLSLVAEKPTRRELFSAYIEDLETVIRRVQESAEENSMTSFDLRLKDVHVDNYTDAAIYPVLLNSINSDERLQAEKQRKRRAGPPSRDTDTTSDNMSVVDEDIGEADQQYRPFLRFSAMWERPRGQNATVVKYCAMRALELKVALDTSTIYIYFLDLHGDLAQDPVFIDSTDPRGLQRYFEEFNAKVLDTQLYHVNAQDVDTAVAFRQAQAYKYFFEALIIHPLKITLTFTPTSVPAARNAAAAAAFGGNNKLRLLPKVAAVEDFELKVKSFIVDHAMESIRSLSQRVLAKTALDLRSQMLQIAGNLVGSMTLLGKPAGLYKNIGGGVSDFFYEPYMGIMESPQAFIFGLGKGTGSLISGVASGVLGSAASLVSTATGGVSTITEGVANLSGDTKYMQRREEKLRAAKAGQGGMLSGLQAGGESIFTGVTSGLTGLVTKPYEEGRKSGALGVVKGMGMGILGVATKPVMGLTDGLSSIATGFSQQIQDPQKVISHVRPPRAFEQVEDRDTAPPVLVKFDLFAAEAQQYIRRRMVIKGYSDQYLASCTLGYPRSSSRSEDAPFGVVLSKQYVLLLTRSMHKAWKIGFSELSHVTLLVDAQNGAVDFIAYTGSTRSGLSVSGKEDGDSKRVQCASRAAAIKLYSLLTRYAYRMGNPAAVVPVEELVGEEANGGGNGASGGSSRKPAGSQLTGDSAQASQRRSSTFGGSYKFGSINQRDYGSETMSEAQIFAHAQSRLSKIHLGMLQEPGGADRYSIQLDDALWRLISDWRHNHHVVFNPSRCAACLIVNNTPHYVQIMDFELKEGKDYVILGAGEGYDKDSRSLVASGGAVIVFVYGYVPSLTDLAHVKLQIFTSAFSAVISTRRNRTDISNQNGFHAGYLEKVQADYWSKSVISIN